MKKILLILCIVVMFVMVFADGGTTPSFRYEDIQEDDIFIADSDGTFVNEPKDSLFADSTFFGGEVVFDSTVVINDSLYVAENARIDGNFYMSNEGGMYARNNADSDWVLLGYFNTSDRWQWNVEQERGPSYWGSDPGVVMQNWMNITDSGTHGFAPWNINGYIPIYITRDGDGTGDSDGGTLKFNGANIRTITTVNAATYDVLKGDYILNVTYTDTGTCAIDILTLNVVEGRILIFKDADLNASGNNITISTEGSALIDEAATAVISGDGDSISIYCDGTDYWIY